MGPTEAALPQRLCIAPPQFSNEKMLRYSALCNLYAHRLVSVLLARSQIRKVLRPATFSRFPCVYKQMLRWFPRFQVATTCFSCSLRYPARNAHAPYCHLWPDPLYNIFPHYLINGTKIGGKKLLNTKFVF